LLYQRLQHFLNNNMYSTSGRVRSFTENGDQLEF